MFQQLSPSQKEGAGNLTPSITSCMCICVCMQAVYAALLVYIQVRVSLLITSYLLTIVCISLPCILLYHM